MDQRIANPKQIGAIISARRRTLGLNQTDVAAVLAISQGRYSELEKDPSKLTLDRLVPLLNHLGLELVVRDVANRTPDPTSPVNW